MKGISENAFINLKNRPHSITAEVNLRDANTEGVIIAQAGAFGGWTLYMKGGKPHYEYNYLRRRAHQHRGHRGARCGQARDPL